MTMGSHSHQINGNTTLRDGDGAGLYLSACPHASDPGAGSWRGVVPNLRHCEKILSDAEGGAKGALPIPGTPLTTDDDKPKLDLKLG